MFFVEILQKTESWIFLTLTLQLYSYLHSRYCLLRSFFSEVALSLLCTWDTYDVIIGLLYNIDARYMQCALHSGLFFCIKKVQLKKNGSLLPILSSLSCSNALFFFNPLYYFVRASQCVIFWNYSAILFWKNMYFFFTSIASIFPII